MIKINPTKAHVLWASQATTRESVCCTKDLHINATKVSLAASRSQAQPK